MKTPASADRRSWAVLGAAVLVWFLAYFGARWLLRREEMANWLRVTVALLPVLPFALCLLLIIRGIRGMDEMQRRIHLEALALAFPLAILLLMTLGLLQRAIDLPFEDWSYAHVWAYLPLFYILGLAFAMRRYQ